MAAGCPVSREMQDVDGNAHPSTTAAWMKSMPSASISGSLTETTLEVARVLLQAAAAEGPGEPCYLGCATMAYAFGGTVEPELVQAVVAAFPDGPRIWAEHCPLGACCRMLEVAFHKRPYQRFPLLQVQVRASPWPSFHSPFAFNHAGMHDAD